MAVAGTTPKTKTVQGNYWLVKTVAAGKTLAEVQNLPAGQKPLAANWGGAVYLGSTVKTANNAIANAAHKLGVLNPTKIPPLSMTVGFIAAEAGGAAVAPGAAAVEAATAGGATAAAGDAAATAAEGGAAGGATAAATSATSGLLSKLAGGALIAALVSTYGVRLLEVVGGGALILLGVIVVARPRTPVLP